MNAHDLLDYGWPAIVIALAGYILMIEKRHRDEREEWRRTTEKQFDEQSRQSRESFGIMQAIKTLLESRR